MRTFVAMLFYLFPFISAEANTLILIIRDDKTAVIWADSAISAAGIVPRGNTCKIHITNNIVWVVTGMVQETSGTFNMFAQTEMAIEQGGSLVQIASRLSQSTFGEIQRMLSRLKAGDPFGYSQVVKGAPIPIVKIFMIEGTNLFSLEFLLRDKDVPLSLQTSAKSCPGSCPVSRPIRVVAGDHGAADIELDHNPNLFARGFVEGMRILTQIQHAASPMTVDGPISALSIDRGGNKTWLEKGLCQ